MYEKVVELIAEQFDMEPEDISRETSLVDDLGADSLDVVEFTMVLEEEFGIPEIPEDELKAITTLGDLLDYLSRFVDAG